MHDHGDSFFHLSGYVIIDYKLTLWFIFLYIVVEPILKGVKNERYHFFALKNVCFTKFFHQNSAPLWVVVRNYVMCHSLLLLWCFYATNTVSGIMDLLGKHFSENMDAFFCDLFIFSFSFGSFRPFKCIFALRLWSVRLSDIFWLEQYRY